MNVHLEKIAVISLPRFGWKNFEVNRKMSPDSVTILLLFYQYDFVVGVHDKCP